MISCARCGLPFWCWGRWWRATAGPRCRCPGAARSARGRSICICRGLRQLGAEIELTEGYVIARAPKGLTGAQIVFPKVSVGATENLMLAATLARGETELVNVAREPEINDLALCLQNMGADIQGLGTDRIRIRGVERLRGTSHQTVGDRIEAGTYAMAAAITDGEIELIGARLGLLGAVADALRSAGVAITETNRGLKVQRANGELRGVDVMTEPFPGFATDLQAQMMATMATAQGAAMITETIFENRFMHVPELCRMGASINVHGASAMVRGVPRLTGAPVMATDLRASVSLVLAGLAAEGDTILNRVYHLDRGYERLTEKLAACGAEIERLEGLRRAMADALKLRARDAGDLEMIAAILQDALVPLDGHEISPAGAALRAHAEPLPLGRRAEGACRERRLPLRTAGEAGGDEIRGAGRCPLRRPGRHRLRAGACGFGLRQGAERQASGHGSRGARAASSRS